MSADLASFIERTASPSDFVQIQEQIFFPSKSPVAGHEPHVSASIGTPFEQVWLDVLPGVESSGPSDFVRIGNEVAFLTCIGEYENQLWISDDSDAGHRQLAEFGDVNDPHPIRSIVGVTDTAVVMSRRAVPTAEIAFPNQILIHPLDGSEPITLGEGLSSSDMTTVVGDSVVVLVEELGSSDRVWISDGTSSGTVFLSDLLPQITGESFRIGFRPAPLSGGVGLEIESESFGNSFVHVTHNGSQPVVTVLDAPDPAFRSYTIIDAGQHDVLWERETKTFRIINSSGESIPLISESELEAHDGTLNGLDEIQQIGEDHFFVVNERDPVNRMVVYRHRGIDGSVIRLDAIPEPADELLRQTSDRLFYETELAESEPSLVSFNPTDESLVEVQSLVGVDDLQIIATQPDRIAINFRQYGEMVFKIIALPGAEDSQTPETLYEIRSGGTFDDSEPVFGFAFGLESSAIVSVGHSWGTDILRVELHDGRARVIDRIETNASTRPTSRFTTESLSHPAPDLLLFESFDEILLWTMDGQSVKLHGYVDPVWSDGAIYARDSARQSVARISMSTLEVDYFDVPSLQIASTETGLLIYGNGKVFMLGDQDSELELLVDDLFSTTATPTTDIDEVLANGFWTYVSRTFFATDGSNEGSGVIDSESSILERAQLQAPGRYSQFNALVAESAFPSASAVYRPEDTTEDEAVYFLKRPGQDLLQRFPLPAQRFRRPLRGIDGWYVEGVDRHYFWFDGEDTPREVSSFPRIIESDLSETQTFFATSSENEGGLTRDYDWLAPNGELHSLLALTETGDDTAYRIVPIGSVDGQLYFGRSTIVDGLTTDLTYFRWDGVASAAIIEQALTSEAANGTLYASSRVFQSNGGWIYRADTGIRFVPFASQDIELESANVRANFRSSELLLESNGETGAPILIGSDELRVSSRIPIEELEIQITSLDDLPQSGSTFQLADNANVNLNGDFIARTVTLNLHDGGISVTIQGRTIDLVGNQLNLQIGQVSSDWLVNSKGQAHDLSLGQRGDSFLIEKSGERPAKVEFGSANTNIQVNASSSVDSFSFENAFSFTGVVSIVPMSHSTMLRVPEMVEPTSVLEDNGRRIAKGILDALDVEIDLTFLPDHNFLNRWDASGDGQVTTIDALVIINRLSEINEFQAGTNSQIMGDVNRDGSTTPLDVLVVVNELSQRANADFEAAQSAFLDTRTPDSTKNRSAARDLDQAFAELGVHDEVSARLF